MKNRKALNKWGRRNFLRFSVAAVGLSFSGTFLFRHWRAIVNHIFPHGPRGNGVQAFIAKAATYDQDLSSAIGGGLKELGVTPDEVKGKRILLKPNLVETHVGSGHINTHPAVIQGAVDAFQRLGAASIIVGEGAGHCRDPLLVLEESGLADVLHQSGIPFEDLNYDDWYTVPNMSAVSDLKTLTLPVTLRQVDWIVSMAKMKTHHWAGVTLSMKNLFGLMPSAVYGWPKNVLHIAGIEKCILDINAAVKPHFAIVDGIVGMEGDGPIMGAPKHAGVLVMGRNLVSVDATCTRIMGIAPHRVPYLAAASPVLGTIHESDIVQVGETITSVETEFSLLDHIPSHRRLRG